MKIERQTLINYLASGQKIYQQDRPLLQKANKERNPEIEIQPAELSENLIRYLLEEDELLTPEQKAELSLEFLNHRKDNESTSFWNLKVRGLNTIADVYGSHLANKKVNFDWKLDHRLFPVFVEISLERATRFQPRRLRITLGVQIMNFAENYVLEVNANDLMELNSFYDTLNVQQFFAHFNLFPQRSKLKEHLDRLKKAKALSSKSGTQFVANGNSYDLSTRMQQALYGDRVIIEADLEKDEKREHHVKNPCHLPYLRVFSLDKKAYFWVHVSDLKVYDYQLDAHKKLILSPSVRDLLNRILAKRLVFSNDLVKGKGKGLIILAQGNPGTGKTSTAEVYAETHQKPLYSLQVEELGVNVQAIEQSLPRILKRVEKWNCILLFDEVDIFLSKRDSQLERSAIVGVFLRLIEYFEGLMFFTTNRAEKLDPALLSRVTLLLRYPDLDTEDRARLWKRLFEERGLAISSYKRLAQLELNGRQIRNYANLGFMALEDQLDEQQMIDLIKKFPPA